MEFNCKTQGTYELDLFMNGQLMSLPPSTLHPDISDGPSSCRGETAVLTLSAPTRLDNKRWPPEVNWLRGIESLPCCRSNTGQCVVCLHRMTPLWRLSSKNWWALNIGRAWSRLTWSWESFTVHVPAGLHRSGHWEPLPSPWWKHPWSGSIYERPPPLRSPWPIMWGSDQKWEPPELMQRSWGSASGDCALLEVPNQVRQNWFETKQIPWDCPVFAVLCSGTTLTPCQQFLNSQRNLLGLVCRGHDYPSMSVDKGTYKSFLTWDSSSSVLERYIIKPSWWWN